MDSGIILIKYWLEVSMEEQTRRLADRIDDRARVLLLADQPLALLLVLPEARLQLRFLDLR